MKEKQMACIILAIVIGLTGFGIQKVRTKMVSMRKEAQDAQEKAKAADFQRKAAEQEFANLKQETDGLRDYFEKWLPYLGSGWNTEQEEQKVVEILKAGQVFTTSQRTEVVPNKTGFIQKQLRAHLMIQDDYTKTMNWLGHLEEGMPSARVSSYRVTRGVSGNDIQMELMIDIPLITTGKKET